MSQSGLNVLFLYLLSHFACVFCALSEEDAFCGKILRAPAFRGGFKGFRLRVQGNLHHYRPGSTYRVTLSATGSAYFSGYTLFALKEGKKGENAGGYAGTFQVINEADSQLMRSCPTAVTEIPPRRHTKVHVLWKAPPAGTGCVILKANVLWKGVNSFRNGALVTRRMCEEEQLQGLEEATPSCCACGTAMYRLTFYGNWSEELHPKDYPKVSSHWSAIIGASHSRSYRLWAYGGYASEGVQQLAEQGSPIRMEEEIREKGDEILTVIKAKALWPAWQPLDMRPPPTAEFLVDRLHHVVSFLTMLGPSPDWAVGLSTQDLCTQECRWVQELVRDLLPWDAGVDSGVSYASPAMPTVPRERIRPLTSQENPAGPFYDPEGRPAKPAARVLLERIARKQGEQCSLAQATGDDVIADVKQRQEAKDCRVGARPGCSSPFLGAHAARRILGARLGGALKLRCALALRTGGGICPGVGGAPRARNSRSRDAAVGSKPTSHHHHHHAHQQQEHPHGLIQSNSRIIILFSKLRSTCHERTGG
uniref:Spondin-1-like n=1 Tax=Paramormyrops kingsleyae TaxID=1676925 RepID=A0A3B3QS76_9TELE|nr:spondin-1-like isoform X1 [Paramormyrops kingsleyae]